MQYLKKLGSCYLLMIPFFIIMTFLITILSYFNIINLTFTKIFKLLIPIFTIILGSFKMGKLSTKKGYLQGLYLGLSFFILTLLINLILFQTFNIKSWVYYIILILTSMLGGMLGISKKSQNQS